MFFDPSPIFPLTIAFYTGVIWGLVKGLRYIIDASYREQNKKNAGWIMLWFVGSIIGATWASITWVAVFLNIGKS